MRAAAFALLSICTLNAQIQEVPGTPKPLAALRYIDVSTGSGAVAAAGKKFIVHYTGWLANGTKFDSSRDRNQPFDFVQGRRQVIAGWDIGFDGMRVGGKRRLFIPSLLAYGPKGSGPIPPDSDLIFDVELLQVVEVPDTAPAADVLLSLSDSEFKVMSLARAIPEEKYAWSPAKGVRSVGQVFIHIANGNRLLLQVAEGEVSKQALEELIAKNEKLETQTTGKDAILKTLAESFMEVRKAMEASRAGALSHEVDFFGRTVSRRSVFVMLDAHIAEHLGQTIAYARSIGIVPPWSQPVH